MLARYKMYRGARPVDDPLPDGLRQDTRKHTRHFLRPPAELVVEFLKSPDNVSWKRFARDYRQIVTGRFREDRAPFDELARLATEGDVHLGCSCPTTKNPRVEHCHTYLALQFMKKRFPHLEVRLPR